MKVSVLTPTFNRANLLPKLYNSLLKNLEAKIEIEWLIMDDESTDDTRKVVEEFVNQNKIEIKYYWQENQGKMVAINKLVKEATGDFIIDCDSDDYFTDDAFLIIKEEYEKNIEEKNIEEKNIYGLCFLKYNQNGQNMGNLFKKKLTTMFDLYFKDGETGEKAIVFYSNIRKQYKHELEHNERFVTEARMYHKMDKQYKMLCINRPIMICEYREDGYSKNILKEFKENPYGYYEYFKEIIERDMKHVTFSKRLYVIKHYILFSYLTKNKKSIRNIKNISNKVIYIILYIPGIVKSKMKFHR